MKNFKRFLGTAVTLIMVLTVSVVPAMAKNSYTVGTTQTSLKAATEILFYEDFNDKTTDASITTSDYLGNASGNSIKVQAATGVQIAGNESDKYLKITGTSSATGTFALKESTGNVFKGTYTTEFKFMIPDVTNTSVKRIFANRGAVGTTQKDRYGLRLGINDDKKFAYTQVGSTYQELHSTQLTSGVWYNVKIVTDFENRKYSLYINGRNFLSENAFNYKDNFDSENLDNMLEPLRVADVNGTIYYDDIIMYREPVGRTTYSAEDFSGYSADNNWTTATSKYDTWLEGMDYVPAKQNTYGKIDSVNDRLIMGGYTGKQSVALLNGYQNNKNISKKMAVSFTFTPTDGDGSYGAIYQLREYNGNNPGVFLILNGGSFIADTNDGGIVLLSGIEDNTPYNFTIAADSETKTYSVYIDGVCVGSNLEFKFDGTNAYSDNGRPFEVNLTTGAPECYYDNIVIYTDEREAVMTTAMDSAKTSYSTVSQEQTTFSLPSSTNAGYTLSWSSDNAAIALDGNNATVTYGDEAQSVKLTATVKDASNQFAIERSLVVKVPSKYEVNVVAEDGVVSGTVKVNGTAFEGYNDGWAILAVYSNGVMVDCKKVDVVNGEATVTLDKISDKGSYSARLFLWKKDVIKPITQSATQVEFVID